MSESLIDDFPNERENEYQSEVFSKANDISTAEGLISLVDEINNYNHTYGTIISGCCAAMIAAFNVINKGPQGGITGFQASYIAWEMVSRFMGVNGPMKIIQYDEMLYPQYEYKFEKTIPLETFNYLSKKAACNIEKFNKGELVEPSVYKHQKAISEGFVPFGYEIKDHD